MFAVEILLEAVQTMKKLSDLKLFSFNVLLF